MEHVIICKCVPVVSKIPKFLHPLPGARRRGFLAPGGRAAHALDGSISNRTDAGGFPQRRCPQTPCRRLNFASSCGWRPVVQQFIQFRPYSDGLSPHLFCRQNTCAPIGVVACGSSGPPPPRLGHAPRTTKSAPRPVKAAPRPALAPRRTLQTCSSAAGRTGRTGWPRTSTGRPQPATQARTIARRAWGYWVGCCPQKQEILYIYVFFIFHFL